MRFVRAEDADRAPGFVAAESLRIGGVFGAFKVVAHHGLRILNRHLLFRDEVDRERAARLRVLNKRGVEVLLHHPDARVVVDAVAVVVARIGLREVEGAVLFRVVEALFDRELNKGLRGHHVGRLGVVVLEAPLVAGSKVLLSGRSLGEPLVARTRFEIPDFGLVDEGDAEAFAGALFLNDGAERHGAFAGRAAAREEHVGDVVLGNARFLHVGVDRKGGFARKDRFRAREAEARFIEARGAVKLRLPEGNRREGEGVFRERIRKIVHAAVGLRAVDALLALAGRVVYEMLRFDGGAVGAARNDEGTVDSGFFTGDETRAHVSISLVFERGRGREDPAYTAPDKNRVKCIEEQSGRVFRKARRLVFRTD